MADWSRVYKLTDGKPTGPQVVTLLRVAASLAMMRSRDLHRKMAGLQVTISAASVCSEFPKAMALSNFGALIPTSIEAESTGLMTRVFYYQQYLFDRTINDGNKNFSSRNNIVKYANIQINSSLYSQEQRVSHCRDAGLIEVVGSVTRLTATARPGISSANF